MRYAITKNMTSEQRIAVLKKHWAKFNKKVKRNTRVRKTETNFMDKFSEGQNINAWTDGEKYLNEHYGDRVRETNEYDSEWG